MKVNQEVRGFVVVTIGLLKVNVLSSEECDAVDDWGSQWQKEGEEPCCNNQAVIDEDVILYLVWAVGF